MKSGAYRFAPLGGTPIAIHHRVFRVFQDAFRTCLTPPGNLVLGAQGGIMIGKLFATTACAVWFAGTAAAQPPGLHSIQTALELQTMTASTESARSRTGSVQAPARGPARSFEELQARVKTGDTVYVIDASGLSTRGEIVAISDVSLTVTFHGTRREFAVSVVRRIDRRGRDSVRNGLFTGLGAGALIGWVAGRAADSPTCPRSGIECGQGAIIGTVSGAVWGAVGGWITDALIRKREVIYLAQDQPVTHVWTRTARGPVHQAFEALDSHSQASLEADLIALLRRADRGGAAALNFNSYWDIPTASCSIDCSAAVRHPSPTPSSAAATCSALAL